MVKGSQIRCDSILADPINSMEKHRLYRQFCAVVSVGKRRPDAGTAMLARVDLGIAKRFYDVR